MVINTGLQGSRLDELMTACQLVLCVSEPTLVGISDAKAKW
jgi:MinD superfamily P-loop ATPase